MDSSFSFNFPSIPAAVAPCDDVLNERFSMIDGLIFLLDHLLVLIQCSSEIILNTNNTNGCFQSNDGIAEKNKC